MDEQEAPEWYRRMQAERSEQEDRLIVGQRVRIDLGECRHLNVWHGNIEQGATGDIIGQNIQGISHPVPEAHSYAVLFDWPIRQRILWSYAAHELTPIPRRTREEIEAEVLARLDMTP